MDVNDGLHFPWGWMVATLLLALVALGCFVTAQRSYDHRFGWLLSASVAAGLAIAHLYNFIAAAAAPAIPTAGLSVFIALLLFVARGTRRQYPRR